jgi:TRAP-type C4-dicarboxylate transport system permease large subunit
MTNYLLDAIPLFILMANILEKSGIIEDIYMMVYHWLGWLKGGALAVGAADATAMRAKAMSVRPEAM